MVDFQIVNIVSTSLLTSLGTWAVTAWTFSKSRERQQNEQRRSAEYLAVRVVCALDPFVEQCILLSNDDGQEGEDGRWISAERDPRFNLPQDVDWKSVSPELVYKTLNLPNEIISANQNIAFVFREFASPPDYIEAFEEKKYLYARLGLYALDLATKLRDTYGLPPHEDEQMKPREWLENAMKQNGSLHTD